MAIKISGKPITLNCTEPNFPEFPDLLFGTTESGVTYIDTTLYLQNTGLSLNNFLLLYKGPIEATVKSRELDETQVCVLNHEGHILIESSLAYLIISFVNPDFLAYMFDRMDEMFSIGFTVSDTYLLHSARRRLPMEVLIPNVDASEGSTSDIGLQ